MYDLTFQAAKAKTQLQFDNFLNLIGDINENAKKYLARIVPEHWAEYSFPGKRYGDLTNNISEQLNYHIKMIRDQPMLDALLSMHLKVMTTFEERRSKGAEMDSLLTPKFDNLVKDNMRLGRRMQVQRASECIGVVVDGTKSYSVDLNEKTCSCSQYQRFGYPCKHAL